VPLACPGSTYIVPGLGLTADIKLLHPEAQMSSYTLSTKGVQAVAARIRHAAELAKPLQGMPTSFHQIVLPEYEQPGVVLSP